SSLHSLAGTGPMRGCTCTIVWAASPPKHSEPHRPISARDIFFVIVELPGVRLRQRRAECDFAESGDAHSSSADVGRRSGTGTVAAHGTSARIASVLARGAHAARHISKTH